jgi:hypothetical protein
MPENRWVAHIKKFAKDNNLSYGCAMTDPKIRDGYTPAPKKGKKGKKAVEFEKLEQAFPDTEPKAKNVVIRTRQELDDDADWENEQTMIAINKAEAKKTAKKRGRPAKAKAPAKADLLSADEIDTAVMGVLMGMLNKRNKTGADIAEYRKEADKIGDELEKSFAAKKFGKRVYNALKGDKMLGFVYSEIGKLRGGASGSRVPTSEIQRLRSINRLRKLRQKEFDKGNYNVEVPPLSTINADLDFLGGKSEPQPNNPLTRQALSGGSDRGMMRRSGCSLFC